MLENSRKAFELRPTPHMHAIVNMIFRAGKMEAMNKAQSELKIPKEMPSSENQSLTVRPSPPEALRLIESG
jgi:hypothetical protein